jgi:hypothetical protein
VNNDLALRVAAQRTALHELNATSATLRAFAEQVVTASRETTAVIALRRQSDGGQRFPASKPFANPVTTAEGAYPGPLPSRPAQRPSAQNAGSACLPVQRHR